MRTPLLLLPLLLSTFAPQDSERSTSEVARAYVHHTFQERDLEASAALLADDAFFIDPTGGVFGGPLATGIRGRAAIKELQSSWGLADFHFDHAVNFACGEFGVFAGRARFTYEDGRAFDQVPFATLLRVGKGRVLERRDLGDYRQLVPGTQPAEPELEDLGRAYLDAYLGRRFDELAELSAESVSFQDPTGILIGAGQEVRGRDQVREHLARALGGALTFELERDVEFFFHHTALFAGTCRFSFPGAALGLSVEEAVFELPLLVVLEVRDGQVVQHRDYAGYDDYIKQLAAYREG